MVQSGVLKIRYEVPECGHEMLEGSKGEVIDMLKIHILAVYGLQLSEVVGGGFSKNPDRPSLEMDTSEGEWGIFKDG